MGQHRQALRAKAARRRQEAERVELRAFEKLVKQRELKSQIRTYTKRSMNKILGPTMVLEGVDVGGDDLTAVVTVSYRPLEPINIISITLEV